MDKDKWKRDLGLNATDVSISIFKRKRFYVITGFIGLLIATIVFGDKIEKTCIPGNPDFEKGTGICNARNRKSVEEDKKKEKQEQTAEKQDEMNKKQEQEHHNERLLIFACEETLKQNLRDPDSYSRIQATAYRTEKNALDRYVIIKYRARNGFNGYSFGAVGCKSPTGKVDDIQIVNNTNEP